MLETAFPIFSIGHSTCGGTGTYELEAGSEEVITNQTLEGAEMVKSLLQSKFVRIIKYILDQKPIM